MSDTVIRYDLLVQNALKTVIRKVLGDISRNGIPGDHHFYITFKTHAPGVRVSQRLLDKYPDEMTIVIQHQFWDLQVNEHTFEVGLSFSSIPERLLIPYDAITAFTDPSAPFGLKFEVMEELPASEIAGESKAGKQPTSIAPVRKKLRSVQPGETASLDLPPVEEKKTPAPTAKKGQKDEVSQDSSPPSSKSESSGKTRTSRKKTESAEPTDVTDESGATVVSLDAFRKKPAAKPVE